MSTDRTMLTARGGLANASVRATHNMKQQLHLKTHNPPPTAAKEVKLEFEVKETTSAKKEVKNITNVLTNRQRAVGGGILQAEDGDMPWRWPGTLMAIPWYL